ncbi:MAG TPA: UvrD-helicase domain-containing protein, partial [Myxococcota bacterium]
LGAIHDERDGHRHLLRLLLGAHTIAAGNVGRKSDWPGDTRAAYVAALEAVIAWRHHWRAAAHNDVVRSLVHEALPAVACARESESLAGFDDLLLDTAALLRDDVAARRRLARAFPVLLIDEVQDTDPVQAEIARLLALSPDGDGDDAHDGDDDIASTLFAVGDPRQSIYRFRGADVATFGTLEAAISERGARDVLATNFRSVDGIVAWVNHVYGDAVGGMADYVAQHAWRGAGLLDPVVLLQRSDDDALDEIDAAIAHLRQLLSQPAALATADGGARPLRGNDVMILLPSWGKADVIADRLRAAGLACVVEGGGAFYQRDEVRLLVAAARALAEPGDTVATLLVLRGLFGVSIADVAAYVAAGGVLRLSIVPTVAGVVADALNVLGRLHRRRGHVPLSALLSELLATTKTLAVHALLPTGAARSANVDKLLHIVRELEAEHTSPLAVVQALEQQRLSRRGDKDIDRIDDDGDAIRITTLFKAKGLEAPLVFVLHATRNADAVDHIVDHGAGRIAVKIGELVPADWEQKKLVEAEQAQQERQRWMYVAATRARDQLVIVRTTTPGTKKPTRASALYDVDIAARGLPSAEALPAHDAVWHADDAGTVAVRVRRVSALSTSVVRAAASTFGAHDAAVDALLAAPRATGGDVDGIAWSDRRAAQLKQAQRGCVRWRAAT